LYGLAEVIFSRIAKIPHLKSTQPNQEVLAELERRYGPGEGVTPRVYYRLTDNWLELTVRFIVRDHGIRDVKDAMSRDIIAALDEAGIGIASGTYDIVGLPPIRIQGFSAADLVEARRAAVSPAAQVNDSRNGK
jgi:hypothetical protein